MKLFIMICGLFVSCSIPKKINSGNYVVSEVLEKNQEYSVVRFHGYKTKFQIYSDTLKVNDTIALRVIKIAKRKIKKS